MGEQKAPAFSLFSLASTHTGAPIIMVIMMIIITIISFTMIMMIIRCVDLRTGAFDVPPQEILTRFD